MKLLEFCNICLAIFMCVCSFLEIQARQACYLQQCRSLGWSLLPDIRNFLPDFSTRSTSHKTKTRYTLKLLRPIDASDFELFCDSFHLVTQEISVIH